MLLQKNRWKLLVLLAGLSLPCALVAEAALVPGEKYDFFCRDGQNFRNAEFVREEKSGYRIKLPFSNEEKTISRDDLILEPRLAVGAADPLVAASGRQSILSLGADWGAVQGDLGQSLVSMRQASLQYEYGFSRGLVAKYPFLPSMLLMGAIGEYTGPGRRLSGGNAGLGLGWQLALAHSTSLVLQAAGGMAYYRVHAQTFDEDSRSAIFNLAGGFRYHLHHLVFSLLVRGTMLADASAALYTLGLGMAVGYAF